MPQLEVSLTYLIDVPELASFTPEYPGRHDSVDEAVHVAQQLYTPRSVSLQSVNMSCFLFSIQTCKNGGGGTLVKCVIFFSFFAHFIISGRRIGMQASCHFQCAKFEGKFTLCKR